MKANTNILRRFATSRTEIGGLADFLAEATAHAGAPPPAATQQAFYTARAAITSRYHGSAPEVY